jgi:hypothetical protein
MEGFAIEDEFVSILVERLFFDFKIENIILNFFPTDSCSYKWRKTKT